MTDKPAALRGRAVRDIDEAVRPYQTEAGARVAGNFIRALEYAVKRIREQPAAGSPRYATELDIPGLRVRALRKFPHLIFYVEKKDDIDIWRVLHGARDIPAGIRGPQA